MKLNDLIKTNLWDQTAPTGKQNFNPESMEQFSLLKNSQSTATDRTNIDPMEPLNALEEKFDKAFQVGMSKEAILKAAARVALEEIEKFAEWLDNTPRNRSSEPQRLSQYLKETYGIEQIDQLKNKSK